MGLSSKRAPRRAFLRSAAIGAIGGALLLAGCAVPAQPQVGQVNPPAVVKPATVAPKVVAIDAHDYAFVAPDVIEGGLVTLKLKNLGHEVHHAQLLRLKDGVTFEQFTNAMKEGEAAVFPLITAEGGPSIIGHGGASEVTMDLRPGNYLLACFIQSQDGVPHLAKGMIRPFQVTEAKVAATAPTTSDAVSMVDFGYTMPKTLPAGRSTLKVVNDGKQWHEISVMRLAPGKTIEDVKRYLSGPPDGPPPGEPVGGMQGLEPGASGYMTLDLQPGEYVGLCFIPDPASGKPHVHLGMIAAFTVK